MYNTYILPYIYLYDSFQSSNVLKGKRIRLMFEVFELEVVPNREDCSYDSVEVYDTYLNDDDHSELHGR